MPKNKVIRELRRLLSHIGRLPKALFYDPFRRIYFDWIERKEIIRFEGSVPRGDKIAIYLIFPRHRLLTSHLEAIRYIAAAGYAPLVVSNLPLTAEDRARVIAGAWRYLERPNFGYDFGGYRDAILEIERHLPDLKRLVILNDSVWFPLPGARDWIAQAEASGLDFAAACSHATIYQMKRRPPRGSGLAEYQALEWVYRDKGNRRFHYVSFAQSLGPNVLRHPGFVRFWKRLRLSNSKSQTVRRGEVGFTRWIIKTGLSHGETLNTATLPQQLAELETAELRHIAETAISFGHRYTARAQAAALTDPALDRENLIRLILFVVARQGISYAVPNFTIPRGFAFLKKSPIWEDRRASDITLDVIAGLEGDWARTIHAEALSLLPFPAETRARAPG